MEKAPKKYPSLKEVAPVTLSNKPSSNNRGQEGPTPWDREPTAGAKAGGRTEATEEARGEGSARGELPGTAASSDSCSVTVS